MSLPARVLLIGNGVEHLAERASVLRCFWAVETVALDMEQVPELGADMVVICSTLPDEERQEWVDRVRRASPMGLVIKMNGFDSGPFAGADAIVDDELGPGALVSKIYELITERGLRSRSWQSDPFEGLRLIEA